MLLIELEMGFFNMSVEIGQKVGIWIYLEEIF